MADEKNQFNRYMDEVFKERRRQNEKHGGPEHDDKHSSNDWIATISKQLGKGVVYEFFGEAEEERFRRQMICVIAVAIAALESMDRKSKVSSELNSIDGVIEGRR